MRARTLLFVLAFTLVSLATGSSALSTGSRAPEIGLRSLDGDQIRMRSLRGKVVIVDFWASWCGPCREELPVLNRLYERYKDQGLVVIGVSQDTQARNARGFLRRTPVDFPVVIDDDHEVAGRYDPPRMPSSYIIDRRGVVRHVHEGFRSGDERSIEQHVRRLLRQRAR